MRRKSETINMTATPPGKLTWLLSVVLTTWLSMGFTFMLTSTYELEIESVYFTVVTMINALIATLIHVKTEKRKWISLIVIFLTPVLIFGFIYSDLMGSLEGFDHVMWYLKEYSFRSLDMRFTRSRDGESVVTMLMVFLNIFPVMVTTWVLTRRKSVIWSILTYVPFFGCSVALNYMFPSEVWCEVAISGVILMCLFNNLKKSERRSCEKKILLLTIPAILLAVGVGVLFPKEEYNKQELAAKQMETIRSIIRTTSKSKTVQDIAQGAQKLPGTNQIVEKASKSYMGSVIMQTAASEIASMTPRTENLLNAGNFDPPVFAVLSIKRSVNPDKTGVSSSPYLYLKSSSMTEYTGTAWNYSFVEPDYDKCVDTSGQWNISAESDYILHIDSKLTSEVYFVPYYMDGYYVSSDIASRIEVKDYYNILQQEASARSRSYDFAVADLPIQGSEDRWTEAYLKYVNGECLEVPEETMEAILESGMLPDWFMDVMNGTTTMTDLEKVRAVTDFVSRLHPYDAHTDFPPDDEDFVVWFMTKAQTGFCVHYATTAVILLRMLDVPARYVTGYMVNNLRNDTLTEVMSTDAHAWFEFFSPEYGWVLGDATPGNANAASSFDVNAIAASTSQPLDPVPEHTFSNPPAGGNPATLTTPTPAVTRDPNQSPTPTLSPTDAPRRPDGEAGTTEEGSDSSGLFHSFTSRAIAALVTLLALAVLLRLAYIAIWKRALRSANINERARNYYRYFSMISRKWKGRPASRTSFIAQKAAFSSEGISEEELEMLVMSGKRGLADIKKKQPWYRRVPVELLWEVKI